MRPTACFLTLGASGASATASQLSSSSSLPPPPFAGERPITSCAQLLITKKPADFDFIALDASSLVGGALRLAKNANTEQRRHREASRHVAQGIQQILKRVHCRSSLLIALDGAESLSKAAALRASAQTRRLESRLARLPGTALMQSVEERLVRAMPDRPYMPKEVVISGTGAAGSVEEKMAAWALDIACRSDFHAGSGPTLAFVGPQDMYLTALAMTPYYNVSSLVQGTGADVRQMSTAAMLEWLGLTQLATAGHSRAVARARTDAVFLLMLCTGNSTTELPAVAGARFSVVFARYHAALTQAILRPGAGPREDDVFLFSDVQGNALELNVDNLLALLESSIAGGGSGGGVADGRTAGLAGSYLELALQAHTSICLGYTPDPLYLPAAGIAVLGQGGDKALKGGKAGGGVAITDVVGYLRLLRSAGTLRLRAQRAGGTDEQRTQQERESAASKRANGDGDTGEGASNDDTAAAPPPPTEEGHRSEADSDAFTPFFSPTQPLTCGEYTALCHATTPGVDAALQLYMGRCAAYTPQETAKRITTADARAALTLTRAVLSSVDPAAAHKCVRLAPSYCWAQNPRSRMWRMHYVDLGRRAAEAEVRRLRNDRAGVSMSLQSTLEDPVLYDAATSQWVAVLRFPCGAEAATEAPTAPSEGATTGARATLKVLTWNVMFDRYSGQPTPLGMPGIDWCTPQRYPVLAKLIAAEDADVVAMQEVEPAFLEFLAQQPWCRERYMLSCTPESAVLSPWGTAMLVHRQRLPIAALTHVNVPAWSGHTSLMPIATLRRGGPSRAQSPIHVAGIHLLAPFTSSNVNARTAQDQALRHRLTRGIPASEECIAMGDFNDWPTSIFEMPAATQYRECWPLLHPSDPGKTMDETNTFCKLKIEELFFGRADKVFVRGQSLRPVEAHLVGTRSVNDENGNAEAPAYLFPSDHYGVSVTFALQ